MTVLASQPCILNFLNSATKKRPRKGGPSLGRNPIYILYLWQSILFEFYPDCVLCVAKMLPHLFFYPLRLIKNSFVKLSGNWSFNRTGTTFTSRTSKVSRFIHTHALPLLPKRVYECRGLPSKEFSATLDWTPIFRPSN